LRERVRPALRPPGERSDDVRARVRAAFLAAADRPAAPLVRAALRAAADRSTAVRRVAVRAAAVRVVEDPAGRDDRAGAVDVFRAPRTAVRDAPGRPRVVVVVRFDALAVRLSAVGPLRVRGFAVARAVVLVVVVFAARLGLVMPVAAAGAACAMPGLPARLALRVFTMVCLSGM
jgi:hypothetical protein